MMHGFTTRSTQINDVVDELVYRSYVSQRFTFPENPAEDWARIFGDRTQQLCESRFQMEFNDGSVN